MRGNEERMKGPLIQTTDTGGWEAERRGGRRGGRREKKGRRGETLLMEYSGRLPTLGEAWEQ